MAEAAAAGDWIDLDAEPGDIEERLAILEENNAAPTAQEIYQRELAKTGLPF